MAKFKQAIYWLKKGEKVTRPCWKKDSYWKIGVDQIIFWADGTKATVHLNQLEADDWKLYEEDIWKQLEEEIWETRVKSGKYKYFLQMGYVRPIINKFRRRLKCL
ncbi:MAG: hypothetical protein QQN44_06720 [Nitrosopumilus sp.]